MSDPPPPMDVPEYQSNLTRNLQALPQQPPVYNRFVSDSNSLPYHTPTVISESYSSVPYGSVHGSVSESLPGVPGSLTGAPGSLNGSVLGSLPHGSVPGSVGSLRRSSINPEYFQSGYPYLPQPVPTTNVSTDAAYHRTGSVPVTGFGGDSSLQSQSIGQSMGQSIGQGQSMGQGQIQGNDHLNLHGHSIPNSVQDHYQNQSNHSHHSIGSSVHEQSTLAQSVYEKTNPPSLTGQEMPESMLSDRYMSYDEFFRGLTDKSEEHLNIIDFPSDYLIMMLSCLLTKIVEANDKLHPNHFDNTIAFRYRLKLEKKFRNQRKQRLQEDMEVDDDTSDDENSEVNRHLANVLAFHGINVPEIPIHAYLTRVLKYCPVTNEIFLSLLVYFDRIAKRANNLKKKREEDGDSAFEQLFVMDSFNIHRLLISGITVSSKFFSDVFYKNSRYAKVGGLSLEELNYLELQFMLLLDFKLMISVEDLQNYGDLLLRFWKREQITSELREPTENKPPESK